jgi:hypothetical protein
MNANELADKLQELDSKLHLIELFKSATMLRQQQAEIEGLKAVLKQEGIEVGRDLLNGGIALFRKASEK